MKISANRKKGSRLLSLILILTVAVIAVTTVTASAVWLGLEEWSKTVVAASDETVSFGADKLVKVNGSDDVRKIRIYANKGNSSAFKVESMGDDSLKYDWKKVSGNSSSTTLEFETNNTLTSSDIQTALNMIKVSFAKSTKNPSGEIKLQIQYRDRYWNYYYVAGEVNIKFIDFATGVLDTSNLKVGYNADNGNKKYISFVDQNHTSEDKNTAATIFNASEDGTANLTMRISSYGGASKVIYGYQMKNTDETWAGKEILGENSVNKNNGNNPLALNVTGFEAGTIKDVRGVVITDNNRSAPKYTEEIRIKYDKPAINSFNIGAIDRPILAGETKTLTVSGVFNNENYDGKNNARYDDSGSVYGPTVDVNIYFSKKFSSEERVFQKDGESVTAAVDNTDWGNPIHSTTIPLQGYGQEVLSRNLNVSFNHVIPAEDSVNAIDSRDCVYRVEVTDAVTGYTTYMVSNSFTIDSTRPSVPKIMAKSGDDDGNDDGIQDGETIGGSDSKVQMIIGDSNDGEGSGIKEYAYSMYYLSTKDGDELIGAGATTEKILAKMMEFTSENGKHPAGSYTDWTSLKTEDNRSSFNIAKDGYYRVIARAVDNAGRVSDVENRTFRVDLTKPSTPEVRLVKQTNTNDANPTFTPYDDRTYSESTVWMLVKFPVDTGKTIEAYQYSFDGGLQWITENKTGNTFIKGMEKVFYRDSLSGHKPYDITDCEEFNYDARVKINKEDYQSITARSLDTLGNTSLVSKALTMRTFVEIKKSGLLKHEGIEVALSLGNSTMETSLLTGDLKNSAAKKINIQYYGKDHKAITRLNNHSCSWNSDDAVGECVDKSCPYTTTEYEYFTPSMVNVQGMSGADANSSNEFNWVRFDHTYYENFATAGYTSATNPSYVNIRASGRNELNANSSPLVHRISTSIEGLADKNSKDSRTGLYTQVTDRVIYLGQNQPAKYELNTSSNKYEWNIPSNPNYAWTAGAGKSSPLSYSDNHSFSYSGSAVAVAITEPSIVNQVYVDWVGDYNSETGYLKKTANWQIATSYLTSPTVWTSGMQLRRIYHMMDISVPNPVETIATSTLYSYDQSDPDKLNMSSIATAGYYRNAPRDWLFLYNDQPAKKEILFTVDDKTAYAHANDGYGFLFNTTIRQSSGKNGSDGSWRMSGYMFFIANDYTETASNLNANNQITGNRDISMCENLTGYKYYVLKIDDVNMEHFADSAIRGAAGVGTSGYGKKDAYLGKERSLEGATFGGTADNHYHDDIAKFLMYIPGKQDRGRNGNDWIGDIDTAAGTAIENMPKSDGINYGITVLAESEVDTPTVTGKSLYVRNFMLVTEGNNTSIFLYNSGLTGNASSHKTSEELTKKFKSDYHRRNNPTGASTFSSGFKAIEWTYHDSTAQIEGNKNIIRTVRPSVDGYQIGSDAAKNANVHRDTNCYGFGPLVSARSYSHACSSDTRIVIKNITMTMNVMRKLSDVVTEPQWGGGKAKFITNISDDSVDDFQDPILSAQIQWRLFNDSAKFIGWGDKKNQQETIDFLDRIEGDGMFEINDISETDNLAKQDEKLLNQIDDVAEYITRAYYNEFGYDTQKDSRPIADQFDESIKAKGGVYSLDDAANMEFKVEPEILNTKTANADFPSGRWYIVHDVNGYSVEKSARSEKYSDALNLNITAPGRYTVYFAPDTNKVKNGTLDPNDEEAIFDFVINQRPISQFSGSIKEISREDGSIVEAVVLNNASYDPDVPPGTVSVNANDYSYKFIDSEGIEHKDVIYNQGNNIQISGITNIERKWELLYFDKDVETEQQTLVTLARDGWSSDPKRDPHLKTIKELTEGRCTPESGKTYYDEIPEGAVLTVYQRVEDTSSRRVVKYDENKNFAGYEYISTNSTSSTSRINQQNITMGAEVTYAPLSSFSLSSVNMYDTAEGDTANITVTRKSTHPQSRDDYEVTWAVDLGSGYKELVPVDNGKGGLNYYYDGTTPRTLMLLNTEKTACQDGVASGKWTIPKSFFETVGVKKGSSIVLQISESLMGITSEDKLNGITEPRKITDSSARAIYYREDKNPPSLQTVEVDTMIYEGGGTPDPYGNQEGWKKYNYEASNYLDVTAGDKYVNIEISDSVDAEGSLAGYSYYLYSKDNNGNEKNYYNLQSDGTRKLVANKTLATNNLVTTNSKDKQIIKLTSKLFDKRETERPTEVISIAIWAYDTVGNKTTLTKLEDIKFSQSVPMPPAIKAADMSSVVAAEIGNDNGFVDSTGTDKSRSDVDYFINSNTSITFTPRQDEFVLTNDGELVRPGPGVSGNPTPYYVDVYDEADRTNRANIIYTIERYNELDASWSPIYLENNGGGPILQKDIVVEPSTVVELSETGKYRVTARVQNGALAESESRQIIFDIDRDSPSTPTVEVWDVENSNDKVPDEGENTRWIKDAEIHMRGSTEETNPTTAYYQYSINAGEWQNFAFGLQTERAFKITDTGKYSVRIRAIDKAGNTSPEVERIVKVDNTAPLVPKVELKIDSYQYDVYSEFVIKTSHNGHGTIWPSTHSDGRDIVDTPKSNEISVPVIKEEDDKGNVTIKPGSKDFVITPDEGYFIEKVIYDENDVTAQLEEKNGYWKFVAGDVESDRDIIVTFAMKNEKSTRGEIENNKIADDEEKITEEIVNIAPDVPKTSQPSSNTSSAPRSATPRTDSETYKVKFTRNPTLGGISSVNNNAVAEVANGESYEVRFSPASNNKVASVTVNEVEQDIESLKIDYDERYRYALVIDEVTEDTNIVVNFEPLVIYDMKLTSTGKGSAAFLDYNNPEICAGENVEAGTYRVYEGKPVRINVKPKDEDYVIKSIKINGVDQNIQTPDGGEEREYSFIVGDVPSEELEMNIEVAFGIDQYAPVVKVGVIVNGEGTVKPEINEEGVVEVVAGSSEQFILTPRKEDKEQNVPNYMIGSVMLTYHPADADLGETETIDATSRVEPLGNGSYIFPFDNIYGGDGENIIEVTFVPKSYPVTIKVAGNTGGTLDYDVIGPDGEIVEDPDLDHVVEGSSIKLFAESHSGYKLTSVRINGENVGAITEYTILDVRNKMDIEAKFEYKELLSSTTVHTIEVEAQAYSDEHSQLQENALAFSIDGGETWSEWQSSPIYTFRDLDPNKEYEVMVKARDIVGNEGMNLNKATIHTKANGGKAKSVRAIDLPNETNAKAVSVTVDPQGNPRDTEYLIVYSEYDDMKNAKPAIKKDVVLGEGEEPKESDYDWKTLGADNSIEVHHLLPATRYYLSVRTRNNEKIRPKSIIGESTKKEDIVSILLSPVAPDELSLYFEQQAGPQRQVRVGDKVVYRGGIKLTWDNPPTDVQSIVIYRGGTEIAERPATDLTFTDYGFEANRVITYSYAYKNGAGIGSSRTAISKQYRDAVIKADEQGDPSDKNRLDSLKGSYEELYTEVLTYPSFPREVQLVTNTEKGTGQYSGLIEVALKRVEETTSRNQRYWVRLKAFDPNNGYKEVPVLGPDGKPLSENLADKQLVKPTTETPENGPSTYWENLDVNYEYRVYLDMVETIGPRSLSSSGSEKGIEGDHGKRYYVTEDGYGSSYEYSASGNILGEETGQWGGTEIVSGQTVTITPADDKTAFVKADGGWKAPIKTRNKNNEVVSYIKFNKMPSAELPSEPYDKNQPAYDKDRECIVLNLDSDPNKPQEFTVNVAAWDPDGEPHLTINGNIGGRNGIAAVPVVVYNPPTTREEALKNPYTLTFSSKGLTSGVYESLEITVSDKQLTTAPISIDNIKIIVNQARPAINVAGGTQTRLIETESNFADFPLSVNTSISAANVREADLRKLRLEIFDERYIRYFGTNDEAAIRAMFVEPKNPSAVASAKEILGESAYNALLWGNDYDFTNSTNKIIDGVNPEVTRFVASNKTQYDAAVASGKTDKFLVERINAELTRYWIEYDYCLDTYGKCDWITRENGKDIITGEISTTKTEVSYPLKLRAEFGGNQSTATQYFKITEKPNIEVLSSASWEWREVSQEEFTYYEENEYTIAYVCDEIYNGEYGYPELEDGETLASPAYKYIYAKDELGNDTDVRVGWSALKYFDKHMQISNTEITAHVDVEAGIHEYFDTAGVYVTSNVYFNPNIDPSGVEPSMLTAPGTSTKITSGRYSFTNSGLKPGETYYLWAFYTKDGVATYKEKSVKLTTNATLKIAYYGFARDKMTYSDSEGNSNGRPLSFTVHASGDTEPAATIKAEMEYYQADEKGNILYEDPETKLKPLKFENGEETIKFNPLGGDVRDFAHSASGEKTTSQNYAILLYRNPTQQGHMVARVTLKVVSGGKTSGINYISDINNVYDIFVIDSETPITEYKIGVVNDTGEDGKLVLEERDKHYYKYQFDGQPVGYNNPPSVYIKYNNIGTGNLQNIRAEVYDDKDGTIPSSKFSVDMPVTEIVSPVVDPDILPETFILWPVVDLPDGVHKAWVKLTADEVKEPVWIEVTQVVGQSTIFGKIYFTPEMSYDDTIITSEATVKIYSEYATYSQSAGFLEEPLFTVTTNAEANGTFRIPHILNENDKGNPASYYVVVEKEGFITFNSVAPEFKKYTLEDGTEVERDGRFTFDRGSHEYEFNLRLLAGDVNLDEKVDDNDYTFLENEFNKSYDKTKTNEELEALGLKNIKTADLNFDGTVNALDRMILWGNKNKQSLEPKVGEKDVVVAYDYRADKNRPRNVNSDVGR